MSHVLVTGSAGVIGQAAIRALIAAGHTVRGFDLRPTPNLSDSHTGSVSDAEAIDRAVAGPPSVDAIIHLGAVTDDADFMSQILPNNIIGVFNVMEAARKHNVQRVVLASSGQVVSGLRWREIKDRDITAADGVAPTNYYAVSKAFAENLGFMYAHRHKMIVIAGRFGWLPRHAAGAADLAARPRAWDVYLSHDDAGRFFVRCLAADVTGFHAFFVVSRRTVNRYGQDLEAPRKVLGYEPQDVFPQGLPFEFKLPDAAKT